MHVGAAGSAARAAGRRRRAAAALLLALAAGATRADETALAHKRAWSPVDPALAAFAGADAREKRAAPADAWPRIMRADGIVIDAASNGDPIRLLAELEAIGLREGAVAGNLVSGVLPFDAVDALASCESLAAARPALATTQRALRHRARGRSGSGSVVSQGVAAMRADRLPARVRGAGVGVGILADSFDCLGGGRAADTASGDLPGDVAILADADLAGCLDEGRALAQIVHDVAPQSRLGFHTGFLGHADFALGIGELAREFGADVIVDDVLYFDEPFFQDGPVARAVDAVRDEGVAYFAAAGNAGRRSMEAPFRDSGDTGFWQALGETRRHDFDPGPGVDPLQTVTLPPGGVTILVLQWDEPFASASTADPPVGAASDYDLIVYNTEAPRPGRFLDLVAASIAFNPGGDAFEAVVLENPGDAPLEVYVAIERFLGPGFEGPDVERLKTIAFGSSVALEWEAETGGPTSFGHANARGAIAVGAAAWYETPRFGVAPPLLEPFSSAGGIPILFDGAGARLPEPELRETPDLVAPDGVNTTFFAAPFDIAEDDDAFPNFFGSSAAAPHAAAAAALLEGAAGGGAALVDRSGALRGLRMCFVWRWRHLRIPFDFAVPPAQAAAALAAGATPGRCGSPTPERLERTLERSAVDMGAPGYDRDSGHGLVDVRAALRRLVRGGGGSGAWGAAP